MTKHTKPEHKRRTENVNVGMTKTQKESLENLAEKEGKSVSEYVRNILFGGN